MNKQTFIKAFKDAKRYAGKNAPVILTGVGIAGMITTTVLAVKATPKALELMEQKRVEECKDELTVKETVVATWKCYAPAVALGAASVACLIGANSMSTRRTAALATAYKLSETAFSEYKEKVVETIGEKKENLVQEKIAEDKLKQNPVTKKEVIITGKGKSLCYDPLSDRYFEHDRESILRAENRLNKRLNHDIGGYVTINDYYDELEIPHTDVGDSMGWSSDYQLDLHIIAKVADDGRPALVLGHHNPPKHDYYY